ncbi:MAG: hypothetical protein ACYTXA_32055 [Nostoc sp.]
MYIIYPQMDEVNPSIADEKLKGCIVAIYVTGLVISPLSSPSPSSPHLLSSNG